MSDREPNVIVVSAPSGAGKSTVVSRVVTEVGGLRFSVSHTTRTPRAGEADGIHYHFTDRRTFQSMVSGGRMLEWAEVHGQLYGTALAEYERARHDALDLLLDLDIQGAAQVRLKLPDSVSLFILPPSREALERRLRGRAQDDDAEIERRLEAALEEVSVAGEYDYAVVNDDLDACVEATKAIVRAARCRTSRQKAAVDRVIDTFKL